MIKLVVVGSVTEDVIISPSNEETRFIGGVPVYAASIAMVMGELIGIVSKVGTDFTVGNLKLLNSFGADLNGFKIAGSSSMKFENRYSSKGARIQKVLSISDKITYADIPEEYYHALGIHLGPVFNEIDPSVILEIKKHFNFISLDGQGFTRAIEEESHKVILKPWLTFKEYLPLINVLKVDDKELKSLTDSPSLSKAISLVLKTGLEFLVITLASKGAIIYHKNVRYDIPAIPTEVIDETGAGDTFITTFLLEYLRTNNCYYSGFIAASAASFKISIAGPIPSFTREDIINRLKKFHPEFEEK